MRSLLCAVSLLSYVALNQAVRINIGHIYWHNSELPVMAMAYNDLMEQGILPANYNFKLYSRMGCALYNRNLPAISGAEQAIDLYFNENVNVFFGPQCSEEAVVVGQMAAAVNWNLPVLNYLSSGDAHSDKTVFTTLARTSLQSAKYIAQAIKIIVTKNGWKNVACVGANSYPSNRNRKAVTNALTSAGISVYNVLFNPNSTWQSVASSKAMINLRAKARIVLVMFDNEMNSSVPFMAAAHSLGYTADPDFVFIIFQLASSYTSRPWDKNYDGMSYPYLLAAYEGAYILMVVGLDFTSINIFRQKLFDSQNFTSSPSIATVMPLYDAVILYGIALNKSLVTTGNKTAFMNGAFMFQQMKNVEFPGITSQVLIDNNGDRIPSYHFARIPKNVNRIYMMMMVIDANRAYDCDPTILGNLCYPYITTVTADFLAIVWPLDVPVCGYSGERCNQTVADAINLQEQQPPNTARVID